MEVKKSLLRIVQYAGKTGIEFCQTGRIHHKDLGLPDCRGFSPHLRTVNLNKNQSKTKLLKPSHRWLLHDILHIMFYDFALHYLGVSALKEESRFLEIHLASEAFAVLALDYHILSQTKQGGLASDIKKSNWQGFLKCNATLPHFQSAEFCKILTMLYLSGEVTPLKSNRPSAKYNRWVGHEVRYAEKQRYYVKMWWNDLNCLPVGQASVKVHNSTIHEAVWEMIELLAGPDEKWNEWMAQVKPAANYFSAFPKFLPNEITDFRFADVLAVEKQSLQKVLARSKPSGPMLFALWQILSKISRFTSAEKAAILRLARDSNKSRVSPQNWKSVLSLCLDKLEKKKWPMDHSRAGHFFLP